SHRPHPGSGHLRLCRLPRLRRLRRCSTCPLQRRPPHPVLQLRLRTQRRTRLWSGLRTRLWSRPYRSQIRRILLEMRRIRHEAQAVLRTIQTSNC
ncbi:hypothetical protein IscW_ISCW007916, partial [Ixodes scapularis]